MAKTQIPVLIYLEIMKTFRESRRLGILKFRFGISLQIPVPKVFGLGYYTEPPLIKLLVYQKLIKDLFVIHLCCNFPFAILAHLFYCNMQHFKMNYFMSFYVSKLIERIEQKKG